MQYRETDFNFVSRLMEHEGIYYYFRHTDGHNTVVLTDSTGKHAATPGYENDPVHRARAGREAGARAHQQLGLRARDPARRLRARRLRSRAAERRAADAEGGLAHATRRATTRSTTTRGTTCRRPTASSMRRCASTSSAASSRPRRRSTNAKGVCGRIAVHARGLPARGSEPRAPDSGGELRPGVQRLRSDARGRRHELSVQLRRDVERAAVPAEADRRPSRSSRGRRRRWSSARPATRSTPTSTGG